MIDFGLILAFGLVLGIIAGVLPGVGTPGLLSLMFLFLLKLDPVSLLLFYICILTAAQYFGSTIAILSGIPGDAASIPAARWGPDLARKGLGASLLFNTAKYSFISGTLAFSAVLLMLLFNLYWSKSVSVIFQVFFVCLALFSIALISNNKKITNLILIALGYLLGMVGYSANFLDYFATFGSTALANGIPWLPVLLGFLGIPGIYGLFMMKRAEVILTNSSSAESKSSLNKAATRGGFVGFVIGTVPGLSFILGSIMAAKIEEKHSGDPEKIVIASESANNSGAASVLLPFLMFGIPITASESIIFTVLTGNISSSSISTIFVTNWQVFAVSFLLINMVLFFTAWKYAKGICTFVFQNARLFAILALIASVCSVIYIGIYETRLLASIVALLVSSWLALVFRQTDWTPLIFAMLLQDFIESVIYRAWQLYF